MNPNKYMLVALVGLTSLSVIGCGSDGNNSNGNTNVDNNNGAVTSNPITINLFDSKYDGSAEAIKRVQWVYENGDRKLNEENIIGINTREGLHNNDSTVLGDNFQSVLAKDTIVIENNRISYTLDDINSGRTENLSLELIPIDLTGVTAKDGNSDTETGLITDLVYYDKIPNTVAFPSGSLCYIISETSTTNFYSFDPLTDASGYPSLAGWEQTYSSASGQQPIRIEHTAVGPNNQYPVTRIVYNTDSTKQHENYDAINYENVVYDADYTAKGNVVENTSLNEGAVDCSIVNDTAADFLETQILQYYP